MPRNSKPEPDPDFNPELTPAQMLAAGVFGGAYCVDLAMVAAGAPVSEASFMGQGAEFPAEWFATARLASDGIASPDNNCFGVAASQSLATWQAKGWIHPADPCGWFQWYCRYYLGRRIEAEDARQIKRWRAYTRHRSQVINNCLPGDITCRPKQRQSLLHWAYDSRDL